ncbi:MAG: hypothetical protein CVT95_13580 [Bacteroidetes bacterium HGW-Bacteroidetes-12]|nr:MAG: hypothetical protein CVT95_13580 [Bacteroidetes bacterium HGW-Bacteroidetes-12]
MKNSYKTFFLSFTIIFFLSVLLTSCSTIGLLGEKNSWLVHNITSVGDFLKVYIVLQISILLVSVILSFFLDRLGFIIALILHFIWIVTYRDYGFFKVLLHFGLFTIISIILNTIRGNRRNSLI